MKRTLNNDDGPAGIRPSL